MIIQEPHSTHYLLRNDRTRPSPQSSLSLSTSSSSFDTSDDNILQAAATVTQQSCELLGVKSVGVDYGLVKTGIAATVGYEPKPITILSGYNNEDIEDDNVDDDDNQNTSSQLCHDILDIVQSEQASQIIVGLPLHKNGTEAEQTLVTTLFATELTQCTRQRFGSKVRVYMWDERYTSKFAVARAQSNNHGIGRDDLYGTLDADAACIILEHYYSQNGQGAREIVLAPEQEQECLRVWHETQREEERKLQRATEERMGGRSSKRQQAMERAKQLEAQLQEQGMLGDSRKKKKKKKKKKREKRGPWLAPDGSPTGV